MLGARTNDVQWALKRMGLFERHPSVTEQAVSNTWKISLALFINSACVVLLVNIPSSFTVRSSKCETPVPVYFLLGEHARALGVSGAIEIGSPCRHVCQPGKGRQRLFVVCWIASGFRVQGRWPFFSLETWRKILEDGTWGAGGGARAGSIWIAVRHKQRVVLRGDYVGCPPTEDAPPRNVEATDSD